MKIGIMQPYFFPYIGYWQLLNAVDKYVIYDDVNFIKNGWINRNNILIDGKSSLITLSLSHASPNNLINEVNICPDEVKKNKLLKTVKNAYSKAPYYSSVFPIIENTVMHKNNSLSDALFYSIKSVADYLDISTELIHSTNLNNNKDLRGEEKVIDIVKLLDGKIYINAIGGQTLYKKEDFELNNINLFFLKSNISEYTQFKNNFVPNLSIIDVMMFNSPDKIKEMLNNYELL